MDVSSGLIWGISLSFLLISLLPGSLARYTMPFLAPASWLMALLLTSEHFELPSWLKLSSPRGLASELRLPMVVALLVCVVMLLYAFAATPFLRRREKVRNLAAQINAALPAAEPLYAVDPDYQPFLFYVRDPIVYVAAPAGLPANAHYVLVQPEKATELGKARPDLVQLLRLKDYRNKEAILFRGAGGG